MEKLRSIAEFQGQPSGKRSLIIKAVYRTTHEQLKWKKEYFQIQKHLFSEDLKSFPILNDTGFYQLT